MRKLLDKISDDYQLSLQLTDYLLVSIHLLVGLIFWTIYSFGWASGAEIKNWISGYYFLTPFVLLALFFRNLRNFKFYLTWVIIGLVQLLIYQSLRDNPEFQFARGNAFSGLRALLPSLLVFQVFRLAFFSLLGQEMIVSMNRFRMTMWEDEDKRNMTWIEVLFSMLLAGTIIFFNVI